MTIEQANEQAKEYYKVHKDSFKNWEEGDIKKVWIDENENVCIQYDSGKWWHYKDIDLPFPSWW